MEMTFEFYRVRECDDARARLGRVTREARGLEAAKEIARTLMRTLEMPQRPDAVLITDTDGTELFSGSLGTTIMKSLISTSDAAIVAAGIDIWENEGGATGGLSMDHVYGRRVEADKDNLRRRKERARMKPPTGDVLDRVGKDGDDTT